MNIKKYIQSFRLRTLPLSVSGIILGSCLAFPQMKWSIFFLAILTTLSLQILSNLCNELGDAQRGTDTNQDARPVYGLQAGTITIQEIKRCIWLFIILSIINGSLLIFCAFETFFSWNSLLFLLLGALAIGAAITYTMGKHPYGYHALGDLSVFLFFGLLSTIGAFYLQTQILTMQVTIAACAIGLPIVGVLNVNNIRDMENDLAHHKITFASKIGTRNAKIYHTGLIIGSITLFCCAHLNIVIAFLPIWAVHIYCVWTLNGKKLDSQMPVLSLSTLATAIACGIYWMMR